MIKHVKYVAVSVNFEFWEFRSSMNKYAHSNYNIIAVKLCMVIDVLNTQIIREMVRPAIVIHC